MTLEEANAGLKKLRGADNAYKRSKLIQLLKPVYEFCAICGEFGHKEGEKKYCSDDD